MMSSTIKTNMIAIHNRKAADLIPFLHRRAGENKNVIDLKSIMQALIIASVTSIIGMYATQSVINQSLVTMKEDITELKDDISEIRHDFYTPMRAK